MPVPVGRWMSVAAAVAAAVRQGCEDRRIKNAVVTPWGEWPVRYLYNPRNGKTADISDLEDDEAIGPSIIDWLERSLDIKLS